MPVSGSSESLYEPLPGIRAHLHFANSATTLLSFVLDQLEQQIAGRETVLYMDFNIPHTRLPSRTRRWPHAAP